MEPRGGVGSGASAACEMRAMGRGDKQAAARLPPRAGSPDRRTAQPPSTSKQTMGRRGRTRLEQAGLVEQGGVVLDLLGVWGGLVLRGRGEGGEGGRQ